MRISVGSSSFVSPEYGTEPWPSNSTIRIGRSPFCASLKIGDTVGDFASGVGSPGLLVCAALKASEKDNMTDDKITDDHFMALCGRLLHIGRGTK
jgi:hypothetical protein